VQVALTSALVTPHLRSQIFFGCKNAILAPPLLCGMKINVVRKITSLKLETCNGVICKTPSLKMETCNSYNIWWKDTHDDAKMDAELEKPGKRRQF